MRSSLGVSQAAQTGYRGHHKTPWSAVWGTRCFPSVTTACQSSASGLGVSVLDVFNLGPCASQPWRLPFVVSGRGHSSHGGHGITSSGGFRLGSFGRARRPCPQRSRQLLTSRLPTLRLLASAAPPLALGGPQSPASAFTASAPQTWRLRPPALASPAAASPGSAPPPSALTALASTALPAPALAPLALASSALTSPAAAFPAAAATA